jgi:hypothetical protein
MGNKTTAAAMSLIALLCSVSCVLQIPEIDVRQSTRDANEPARAWTVIVYMAADNGLEGEAVIDLDELESADTRTSPIRVLALLDRGPGNDGSNGDWEGTRLFSVEHDDQETNPVIRSPEIPCAALGLAPGKARELDLSSPKTLGGLLRFAKEVYPAGHYALFIWGYGTGWSVAKDDTSGSMMSIPEMACELGENELDVIGFDTSFAALMETAWEFRDKAGWLAGCAGVDPASGWNYRSFLESFASSDLSVSAFNESLAGQNAATGTGVSVIDLSRLEELRYGFEDLASAAASAVHDAVGRDALRALALTECELYHDDSYPTDSFLDSGSFARALGENASSFCDTEELSMAVSEKADIFLERLEEAVTPSAGGEKRLGIHLIPFFARDTPAASHSANYIKGSGASGQEDFVKTSTGWVPNAVCADSFLDVLFYRPY